MSPAHHDNTKIRVVVPAGNQGEVLERIRSYPQGFFNSNYNCQYDLSAVATFEGVRPRTAIEHSFAKNIKYRINVFKLFHGVPTVGYGLVFVTRRLNPLLASLDLPQRTLGELIMRIKKQSPIERGDFGLSESLLNSVRNLGIDDVNVTVEVPHIAYLTDTSITVLAEETQNPQGIFDYPFIIIECTFYDPDDLPQARKKKHIHWNQLAPYIVQHPECHFILIHHSLKTHSHEIRKIVGKGYPNMTVWLEEAPLSF
jgi:ribonuclease Z